MGLKNSAATICLTNRINLVYYSLPDFWPWAPQSNIYYHDLGISPQTYQGFNIFQTMVRDLDFISAHHALPAKQPFLE